MHHYLRSILSAMFITQLLVAPALALTLDDHYVLTPSTVQKLVAANRSMEHADLPEDTPAQEKEDDQYRVNGELPVERFIVGIERRPKARALVLKHGFTPREYGLATYALLDAVLHLTMEQSTSRQDVARQYARLTKEQQANIVLLRKLGPAAYGSRQ